MNKITKATIFLVLVLLASCSNYSTGEHVGIITKFSYKGNIWKTYEGELLQGGLKSNLDKIQANIFEFSLDADKNNKAIIDTINKAMSAGLPVRMFYTEEILTNCGARGETNYFITDVKIIYN
jgi:hypothetical protein